MTPNANSIYYKIWNTLPALEPELNFFIPSDIVLKQSMKNLGFKYLDTEYPYLNSPYSNIFIDHFKFFFKLLRFNSNSLFTRV